MSFNSEEVSLHSFTFWGLTLYCIVQRATERVYSWRWEWSHSTATVCMLMFEATDGILLESCSLTTKDATTWFWFFVIAHCKLKLSTTEDSFSLTRLWFVSEAVWYIKSVFNDVPGYTNTSLNSWATLWYKLELHESTARSTLCSSWSLPTPHTDFRTLLPKE